MNYKEIIRDTQQFIEQILWIKTKRRQLIRLKPNSAQQKVLNAVDKLKELGKPIRIIILKARQQGISTIAEALLYHDTITHPNTNSLIIADKREKADYLFNIAKLFYDKSPRVLRPMFRCRSKQEMTFENPEIKKSVDDPGLRSNIRIDTAQDAEAGRAMTLQNVHCSEIAFWGNKAEQLVGSILQSVPFIADSMVILESTGNMTGGYFYEEWLRAKRDESAFVPIFLAWHDFEEYSLPLIGTEYSHFPVTEEEEMLREEYHLTDQQIKWRREKMKEFKNPDLFAREYPSNEEEAFLAGGSPVYDTKALQWYKRNAIEPILVGNLHSEYDEDSGGRVINFVKKREGYLSIWQEPLPGEEYVIGADTAEGIEGNDASCAQVLKKSNLKQVAEWHGIRDPDMFARDLEYLGIYYNNAKICVEVNNHGLTTMNSLKENYWNIYYRQVFDELTNEWKEKIGWFTSSTIKPLMVDDLGKKIRERSIGLISSPLINELFTYVYDVTGKTQSEYGKYDDRVTAMQLAAQVLQAEPLGKYQLGLDKEEAYEHGVLTPTVTNQRTDWYNI